VCVCVCVCTTQLRSKIKHVYKHTIKASLCVPVCVCVCLGTGNKTERVKWIGKVRWTEIECKCVCNEACGRVAPPHLCVCVCVCVKHAWPSHVIMQWHQTLSQCVFGLHNIKTARMCVCVCVFGLFTLCLISSRLIFDPERERDTHTHTHTHRVPAVWRL